MKIEFETLEIGKPALRMKPDKVGDYEFLRDLVKSKIPEIDFGAKDSVWLDMTNFFAQTHIVRIEKIDSPEAAAGQTAGNDDNAPGPQGSAQGGAVPPAQS